MVTHRRIQFITGQIAGMIAMVLVLSLLGLLSLEFFFVCTLIILLIVTELTGPITVTPRWRIKIKWFIWIGLLGFTAIGIWRIFEILPSEVLPW